VRLCGVQDGRLLKQKLDIFATTEFNEGKRAKGRIARDGNSERLGKVQNGLLSQVGVVLWVSSSQSALIQMIAYIGEISKNLDLQNGRLDLCVAEDVE
jgi:hypothetical protein